MTTDREALALLLGAAERARPEPEGLRELRAAADAVRRHLLTTEAPDGDCADRIERASAASYAAGVAAGRGSRPGQRHGATVDP